MTGGLHVLVMAAAFLLVIGPLIFLHEFGHYIAGRIFGVKAESFSIGMGREVAGWTDRRGTRWKLSALPLGGYVKFAGDMGPASEPDPAWLRLPPEERAKTLQGKPVWQRFLIVAAGPITNFLVAIAIFAGFFAIWGVARTPPIVAGIIAGSGAQQAGIRIGDRVTSVGGRSVSQFEDVVDFMRIRSSGTFPVGIERGGQAMIVTVTARTVTDVDGLGHPMKRALLGLVPGPRVPVHGPMVVLEASVDHTFGIVRTMVDVLGQIATGQRSAKELGGPLKIAQVSGETATLGPLPFVELMALISINLGFINLLPIPLLDGGHLLFYIIEGVRRRPLPARAQEWAFRSGLALLLGFMLFVTVNDLGSFGLWDKLAGLIRQTG